jgi:hypothetical protein
MKTPPAMKLFMVYGEDDPHRDDAPFKAYIIAATDENAARACVPSGFKIDRVEEWKSQRSYRFPGCRPRDWRGRVALIRSQGCWKTPMPKRLHRPRDPIQLGKLIVDIATGQVAEPKETPPSERARSAGRKGGPARAAALTPEQRSKIARVAAAARWKKR